MVPKARTSNAINGKRMECTGANSVAIASKFPETIARVYRDISDSTSVLRSVHVAEGIATRLAFLQIGCEEWGRQRSFGIAKECLLRIRSHLHTVS